MREYGIFYNGLREPVESLVRCLSRSQFDPIARRIRQVLARA
jgi:hypothetical protein